MICLGCATLCRCKQLPPHPGQEDYVAAGRVTTQSQERTSARRRRVAMADETTLRADAKGKGSVNGGEESSTWVKGERIESEVQVSSWRLDTSTEMEPGETSRDTKAKLPRERDGSAAPLFSLKMYLRRSSSAETYSTDSLSSSQQSNTGVDCAGIVLNCLFCRFYDMIHMLPDSCEGLANHCCPSYKHVITTAESASSSDDDSYIDLDCGVFGSCHDASDCLELAMEVSEICYH
ncbi:myoD family inhibitor domain-containing protein 2 [Oreochromis aureus]|uniref:MyoD family inhibitor domain containing 2 n=1 Tax=Oreochromis aureus TaxID=47969 RepID=A0AAZ1XWJ5_OREAU|nr:myoD family inhibitor domain-containing protein 2 [Oreochromis aureus]